MAFATSNVRRDSFGALKVTYGDWSAAVGDPAGTIGVAGGRVWLANFSDQDTSGPVGHAVNTSPSTSGEVTTVTVYHQSDVTTGRFIIIHS